MNLIFTNSKKELTSKFLKACWRMDLKEAKELLDAGADIHYDSDYPLWIAVDLGSLELAEFLVKNGANVSRTRRLKNRVTQKLSALEYAKEILVESFSIMETNPRVCIYNYLKHVNRKQKILNLN